MPILCYNNPIAYGVDLTPKMFAELSDEKTLVAIKESSGDPRRVTDLINTVGDRYAIFCGVDDIILETVMLGATGWVTGLGLAFPRENQYFWNLMVAGKWDDAAGHLSLVYASLHLERIRNSFITLNWRCRNADWEPSGFAHRDCHWLEPSESRFWLPSIRE